MLEKPNLADQAILSQVQDEYGLHIAQIAFLPIGYDVNTAVYRLETADGTSYFLKLRKGRFYETCVALPQFLKTQGLQAIISPLETQTHRLWGNLEDYKLILYPFIQGQDGYQAALTDRQWLDFGTALHSIHTAQLPPVLRQLIPQETYSPHWRDTVVRFQAQIEMEAFTEPVAAKLAGFMRQRQGTIRQVVRRASQLADALHARSLEFVLTHSDIHPGNLHLTPQGKLYIVDWDNPMFAPKERDLNLIGGGGAGHWRTSREEGLFYQGYFPDQTDRGGDLDRGFQSPALPPPWIDRMALAYYRYERIIVDMAEFCNQLFLTTDGGEDRERSYLYFTGTFLPDHDIEIAIKNDLS